MLPDPTSVPTDMNRPRTYPDQLEDHTLRAEDRSENPHETKAREYLIGYGS